jgi:predicted dehydrogenase
MDKLRLIQFGVGGFGGVWLQNHSSQSPDIDLVAIVDVAPENLRTAGEQAGIPAERRFASLQQAIDAIAADAVLTVTPPPVHIDHARLAFAHGLHLMTEKPLADTLENAQEMVQLARDAKRQLVVSQQYRFNPAIQKLKELVQTEAVGELGHGHMDFYIPADFTGTFREQMEYPMLLDMAIHHFDLIRCITGRDIVKVTAHSFSPAWSWYQHDPGLKMLLELEGGLPFSYSGDWSARGEATSWSGSWRLQCAEGSLHLEADEIRLARSERWSKNPTSEKVEAPPLERSGQTQTLHSFAEAIRTGQPAETNGADNLGSIGAVIAAMTSAREGRTVTSSELLY